MNSFIKSPKIYNIKYTIGVKAIRGIIETQVINVSVPAYSDAQMIRKLRRYVKRHINIKIHTCSVNGEKVKVDSNKFKSS